MSPERSGPDDVSVDGKTASTGAGSLEGANSGTEPPAPTERAPEHNRGGEQVFAVALMVMGALASVESWRYGLTDETSPLGPGAAPFILGLGLVILGALLVLDGARSRRRERALPVEDAVSLAVTRAGGRREGTAPDPRRSWFGAILQDRGLLNAFAILAILAVALAMTPVVGLIPALALAIFAVGRLVERLSWRASISLGVGGGLFLWLVFAEFLNVRVPTGLF